MTATEFASHAPTDGEKYNLRRILEMPPPFSAKGTRVTPRRVQNLIESNLERLAGRMELSSRPARLTVEATNVVPARYFTAAAGRAISVVDLFEGYPVYFQGALVPRRAP